MKGNAATERSTSSHIFSMTRRARGPLIDTVAQWSVTDVRYTFMSGHSVCSHRSSQAMTVAAPDVVVCIRKCFFRKPRGDAVVEHHALFVQHEAVAAAPDAELCPAVDVHTVQERRGVRAS